MGYRRLSTLVACVAALFSVACGESRTLDGEADASIVINLDGAMIDAGVDAGPPSNVGAACSSGADCSGGADLCIPPASLPGGYCSHSCADGSECPDGSVCVNLGGGQAFCLDSCDPAAAERDCRAGYGCADDPMVLAEPVCLPGCEEDTDCSDGLRCDADGGQGGAGNCYDPSAEWGDACATEAECPAGAFCFAEDFSGWPGGACIANTGCDAAANAGCPDGQTCVESTGGGGICLTTCTAEGSECREGYACLATGAHPDRTVCQPACTADSACTSGRVCNPGLGTCAEPFPAGQLGNTCSRRTGGCSGGTCFSEGTTGYPGAYCAYEGCTPGDDSTCAAAGGGVCVPASVEGEPAACHRACTVSTDCARPGYACRDIDGEGPLTGTACMPQCTSNTDCANASRGFVCEPVSGLCRES